MAFRSNKESRTRQILDYLSQMKSNSSSSLDKSTSSELNNTQRWLHDIGLRKIPPTPNRSIRTPSRLNAIISKHPNNVYVPIKVKKAIEKTIEVQSDPDEEEKEKNELYAKELEAASTTTNITVTIAPGFLQEPRLFSFSKPVARGPEPVEEAPAVDSSTEGESTVEEVETSSQEEEKDRTPVSTPIAKKKWDCKECFVVNEPEADSCIACTNPRPGAAPKPFGNTLPGFTNSSTLTNGGTTASNFKFGIATSTNQDKGNSFTSSFSAPPVEKKQWDINEGVVSNEGDSSIASANPGPGTATKPFGSMLPGLTSSSTLTNGGTIAPSFKFGVATSTNQDNGSSIAPSFSAPPAEKKKWDCKECFVVNEPEADSCIACTNSRPGAAPKPFGTTLPGFTNSSTLTNGGTTTSSFKFGVAASTNQDNGNSVTPSFSSTNTVANGTSSNIFQPSGGVPSYQFGMTAQSQDKAANVPSTLPSLFNFGGLPSSTNTVANGTSSNSFQPAVGVPSFQFGSTAPSQPQNAAASTNTGVFNFGQSSQPNLNLFGNQPAPFQNNAPANIPTFGAAAAANSNPFTMPSTSTGRKFIAARRKLRH